MIKRITYLKRRADLTPNDFRAHWRDPHGPIAAHFQGLVVYNQNHVIFAPSTRYFLDGIVELWFGNDQGAAAGRDAAVTAELVVDEPRFLSGLTGYQVTSSAYYPPSTYKTWILGRWESAPDPTAVAALAARLTADQQAAVITHWISADTALFTRSALEVDAAPPQVALVVLHGDTAPTESDLDAVRAVVTSAAGSLLVDVAVLLAQEERVVDCFPERPTGHVQD